MELFKRNPWTRSSDDSQVETTETVFTPVEAVDSETAPRNSAMLVLLIVAAIAFAILVAAIGTWAYHKGHKPAPAPNSSQNLPPAPPTGLQSGR